VVRLSRPRRICGHKVFTKLEVWVYIHGQVATPTSNPNLTKSAKAKKDARNAASGLPDRRRVSVTAGLGPVDRGRCER
jgi:hypothetical protein